MLQHLISTETLRWVLGRIFVLFLYLLLPSYGVFLAVWICSLSMYELVDLRYCIAKQILETTRQLQVLPTYHNAALFKSFAGRTWWEPRPWLRWWRASNPSKCHNPENPTTSSNCVTSTYPRPFDSDFPVMNHLPEPARVFDTLLARGVAVRDNPSQISSFFLHFAALISIDRAESVR